MNCFCRARPGIYHTGIEMEIRIPFNAEPRLKVSGDTRAGFFSVYKFILRLENSLHLCLNLKSISLKL